MTQMTLLMTQVTLVINQESKGIQRPGSFEYQFKKNRLNPKSKIDLLNIKRNHNQFQPFSSNMFLTVKLFLGFKYDLNDSANDSNDTTNDSDDTKKYCFYKKYVKQEFKVQTVLNIKCIF